MSGERNKQRYVIFSIFCVYLQVLTTESAKFFAFSYVELPGAAAPFGRIYITNPGTRVAYVHIRTPLIPYGQPSHVSEDIHVWPGDIANVTVPFSTFLVGSAKENKGIAICSTQDVTVQTVTASTGRSDVMSIPPLSKLGTDYVITNYYTPLANTFTGPMGFGITGMEDNTNIHITIHSPDPHVNVTYNSVIYHNGDTIAESLNKFETLQINIVDTVGGYDLTGCHIQSSNPVVVVAGYGRAIVHGVMLDHQTEVLLPTTQLGTEYYLMPSPTRMGDVLRITSIKNNTAYTVTDNTGVVVLTGTLQAYRYTEMNTTSVNYYTIQTSLPVQVNRFAMSGDVDNAALGDNNMLELHPTALGVSVYTFATMGPKNGSYVSFLGLVLATSDTANVILDGSPLIGATWKIFFNSDFSGTYIRLPDGQAFHRVSLTGGGTFLAYLEQVAYFEGASAPLLETTITAQDPTRGEFMKTLTNVHLSSASLGCFKVKSSLVCIRTCLDNMETCGGMQYSTPTSTCCILTDDDILQSSRSTVAGVQIWQWTSDFDMCGI